MQLILLILLFISFAALAEEGWYKSDKLVEDNSWRKHDGPFMAHLFVSDNPEIIYKRWNGAPSNSAHLINQTRIRDGKYFEIVVIFSGCKADVNGGCSLTGDWVVKKLDGSMYGKMDDSLTYIGPMPERGKILMFSTVGLGLPASSADGMYTVKVTVKDNNGDKNVTLQRIIFVKRGT